MKISCASCNAEYTLRPEMAGKLVKCRRCQSQFRVPLDSGLPPQQKSPPPPPQPVSRPPTPQGSLSGIAPQNEPYEVKSAVQGLNSTVELLEYPPLKGCHSVAAAMALYFSQSQEMLLRQARVTLDNGSCQLQAGLLQFSRGRIQIETDTKGVGGFLKGAIKGAVTGESAVKPIYSGTGQIYLEPTFGQLVILKLDNETVTVADGMFYAVESGVKVTTASAGSVSAGLFGGQGFFMSSLTGSGWVVLSLPVPEHEIIRYTLNGPDDELKVDGAFGLLRRGDISYTAERSTKTLIGSFVSGEGLLQTYRGTGEVWVAPTMDVYDSILRGGLQRAQGTAGKNGNTNKADSVTSGVSAIVNAFSSD